MAAIKPLEDVRYAPPEMNDAMQTCVGACDSSPCSTAHGTCCRPGMTVSARATRLGACNAARRAAHRSTRAVPPPLASRGSRCAAEHPRRAAAGARLLLEQQEAAAAHAETAAQISLTPLLADEELPPSPPLPWAPPPGLQGAWGSLPPRVRGLLLLNVLTILFGSNIAIVKGAQESLGPLAFSAGRFTLAAAAFSPLLARVDAPTRASGLELGILAAAGYAAQAWALTATSASHTAFLSSATVLLVPLIAGFMGRPIPLRTWGATAVAMLGIAALELGSAGASDSAFVGDLAALASAALFAVQLIRTEYHVGRLGTNGAPTLIAAQLATLAACFGCAALLDWKVSGGVFQWDAESLKGLPYGEWVFTGLISTAGTLWLELEAFRDVSSTDAALVYASEPVWGALTAYLLLGERWEGSTWVGAALILAGSVYGQTPGEEDDKDKRP